MVQVVMAALVAVMSVFLAGVDNNTSGSDAGSPTMASDYLASSQIGADNADLPPCNNNESAPVPEPATMLLLGSSLAGLAVWRKNKK